MRFNDRNADSTTVVNMAYSCLYLPMLFSIWSRLATTRFVSLTSSTPYLVFSFLFLLFLISALLRHGNSLVLDRFIHLKVPACPGTPCVFSRRIFL